MPLSAWLYTAFFLLILSLLYIIRRYEKSRQGRKAESHFQKVRSGYLEILDSLQDGYVETDHQGTITHVNLPFLEELGFQKREEINGKKFWDLIQKKYAGDVAGKFNAIFETGLAPDRFETRFYGKDGKRFIGEAAVSPVFELGKLSGTKATIRNNTQRFKAERNLAVQKDFLDELLQQTPVAVVIVATNQEISFVNAAFERLFGHAGEEVIGSKLEDLLSSPEIAGDLKECAAVYPDDKLFMSGKRRTRDGKLIDVEVYAQRFFVGSQNYGHLVFYHDISLRIKAEEILRMAKDVAERDLEMGREMQSGFFPRELPEIQGWDVFAYFKAARQVSGDFYDVFPIGKKGYFGIVIADVCDKGVGAALFMVLLRSLIRSFSEQNREELTAEDLVQHIAVNVNSYIVHTHARSNMFATLVLGILDPKTSRLSFVNGGHDAPVLVHAGGHIGQVLEPTGPAFGFSTDLAFDVKQLDFQPGDLLLSYTDGITEAKSPGGAFYGEERLYRELSGKWPSAFSAVKHLEADLNSHIGGQVQFDDITMLGVRRGLPGESISHSFYQKAELTRLPLFRNFIGESCSLMKVDSNITESLQQAVDEVCSNLILHGYKDLEGGEIFISLRQLKNEIEVLVEDRGQPFNPADLPDPDLSDDLDERPMGGLGVFMVKELVDKVSYERKNGTNRLSLKKKY